MANWIKIIALVLKIPLGIFVLASFGGAVYAAMNKIQGITWATPVIMGCLILAYAIGWFIGRRKNEETLEENPQSQY